MVSFECNAIYVKDVEDRSNIPKGCNAMYVGDVKDVKDRSSTPNGCNAMYVEDALNAFLMVWLKALSLSFPKLFSD